MDSELNDESERTERKLAAILHADVVGYSRLMGEDEDGTLRTLSSYREVINSLVMMHHGRVVGTAGDSVLAEFVSTFEAVECAIEIQGSLSARNAGLPDDRKMLFRIGVNMGEVIVKGSDIFGEGVNIAARLESLAEPGGICISGGVHEQLKNKLSLAYEFLGDKEVKNIAEPVAVFRVGLGPDQTFQKLDARSKPKGATATPPWKWGALAAVVVMLLGAGGFAVWQLDRDTSTPATGATMDHQATTAQPVSGKASIAVLPFVNMSPKITDDAFTDGITEDIITNLAQFEDLEVISRTSMFTYKGKQVKVQQVGKELGVRFVLEGSVRSSGQRVRVTAQLVEAATGFHLWADRYDRDLIEVFALQDELSRAIVVNLAAFAEKPKMKRGRVDGVGTVVEVRNKKNRIVLDHEAIEGHMEAMEMAYKVESAALLDGLEPGEKVVFTIDMENKTIVAIRPHGTQ